MERLLNRAGLLAAVALLIIITVGHGARTALAQPVPPNDNFSGTAFAAVPYSDTQDTTDATTEAGEPAPVCAASFGHSVWYNFTPAASGTYRVDTLSSDFDTVAPAV